MKAGRNDPCPCGSGRKYKACCMDADRAAARAPELLPPAARAEAAAEPVWQADVLPLGASIESDPAARPAAVLVVAGEVAVHANVRSRPSAEPDDVARELEEGVMTAARAVGALPREVQVRDEEVAAALAARLAPRDVAVSRAPFLEDLEPAAASFAEATTGRASRLALASPETWAGWDLPSGTVARLFRAAAAYHRAAPWTWLANLQALDAVVPDGRAWTAAVMGHGGQEFGLALYADPDDFHDTAMIADPEEAFARILGRVLTLTFETRDALSRRMQREVASAGWEVAGPAAYPVLLTLNTPAGGVTRRDAADLIAVLEAVSRFAPRFGERLARGEAVEWRDPETGVVLRHEATDLLGPPSPWGVPARLEPGGAEGPGARPEAALERPEEIDALVKAELAVVERFAGHLLAQGLSEATVAKHRENAGVFVDFLARWQGVPVGAVHEYDLRTFLYDWYPRKVKDARTRALAVPASLRRFFAFLAEREGIVAPWAEPILRDRESFEIRYDTFPGGFWWDRAVGEWREPVHRDLEARVMLHDLRLGEADRWGASMGPVEAALDAELQRRWLLWRDEAIRAGTVAPAEVRAALVARQRAWETTLQPRLGGKTPVEAVLAERSTRDG